MPKPALRVVPELLFPCRAAKGAVGAMIIVALVVLIAATARTDSSESLLAMQETRGEATAGRDRQPLSRSAAVPPSTDYFPAGYTLRAGEPTSHIEAF